MQRSRCDACRGPLCPACRKDLGGVCPDCGGGDYNPLGHALVVGPLPGSPKHVATVDLVSPNESPNENPPRQPSPRS